ncbi:hypothetical protein AN944_02640 [Shewanella sp. P1-14-1]|uniref:hypothetical protein n=1 Tax=Shewanella sp. P1-14-1 TaxID=1723761 RepID=UPI0006D67938|nr:hypothetical protein [Shewanella sp. P1-14-1]KPZ69944.1 hypothetical protein AN944_02640 [Shewanella sp. P1-14-1]
MTSGKSRYINYKKMVELQEAGIFNKQCDLNNQAIDWCRANASGDDKEVAWLLWEYLCGRDPLKEYKSVFQNPNHRQRKSANESVEMLEFARVNGISATARKYGLANKTIRERFDALAGRFLNITKDDLMKPDSWQAEWLIKCVKDGVNLV